MTSIHEAIAARVSCRAYDERPVEAEKLEQLAVAVDRANAQSTSGVRFELASTQGQGAPVVKLSRAMFTGQVFHCIVCLGPNTVLAREQAGYFGEELVLLATQLGLGTCWVAGTYDRETLKANVQPGEEVISIIPVGYATEKTPFKQRTIRNALRGKDKPYEKLVAGDVASTPAWFEAGVRASMLAPTAVNLQPVVYAWQDGAAIATMPGTTRSIQDIDLGICKLHFKLGSQQDGTWEWGVDARFAL